MMTLLANISFSRHVRFEGSVYYVSQVMNHVTIFPSSSVDICSLPSMG